MDEIDGLLAAQDAAWRAGDAEAFAARTLPDIVFTNIVGMFSVGREAFVAQHATIFSTIYQGSVLRQTIAHRAMVTPEVMILDSATQLSGFAVLPPGLDAGDGILHTRLEQVLVNRDGGWWIASFHNVAVTAAVLAGRMPGRD